MFFSLAAAVAAKSLQSCPTLCDPRDGSPWGSPIPGILQARTLEWVAISFSSFLLGVLKISLMRQDKHRESERTLGFYHLKLLRLKMQLILLTPSLVLTFLVVISMRLVFSSIIYCPHAPPPYIHHTSTPVWLFFWGGGVVLGLRCCVQAFSSCS